ncbi:acyltransferase family protein [Brachybacterium squillarum]|uniref:acyltransferase family protein n=1 Tax=Brachybacterium squillarum TaxID=661979 RepID=UPI00222221E8|nr:acyltransferase [Brachybacterium squillarum]MCW1804298.1 acyltransferase [Brachybacterium squillarum]
MSTPVTDRAADLVPVPRARHHWMDLVRGTAIVLVVLLHLEILQGIWDGDTPSALVVLAQAATPFRMPMLLFVSGMLLPRSLRKPPGRFLEGKARNLLWPWLVWSLVLGATQLFESSAEPLWWINGMYTWFLMALLSYYVVGLLLKRVPPGWVAIASIVVWTAAPLFGVSPDLYGLRPDKFVYYAVFFFAGAALGRTLLARKVPLAVAVPGIVVAMIWAVLAVRADGEPQIPVLDQVVVVIGILGAIGVAQRLPRVAPVRALEWMGRSSIVMYVVHLPVLEILTRYLPLPDGLPGALILGTVTLAACIGAVHLRPRTPWLYVFPDLRRRRTAADGGAARGTALRRPDPVSP